MTIKAIILDFDGVVLESVDIKTRAFRELFKGYPEHLDDIIKFHIDNAGMSRFEKFKTIYRDYLKRPLDEREETRLGNTFSELVLEELLRCPFVPGAQRFLEKYSGLYHLFLASATPESELREIVAQRGLALFFRRIYGSPRTKPNILREILREYGWLAGEIMFIGDATNDYLAAKSLGVPFLGRVKEGEFNPFPSDTVMLNDFVQIDSRWSLLLDQLLAEGEGEGN